MTAPRELSDLARARGAGSGCRSANARKASLRDFDELLTQNDLPRARDVLQTAVSFASADARVHKARTRLEQAEAALAAKEAAEARNREAEERFDNAAANLEKGDLAGAAEMLSLGAALAPQHPRAAQLAEQLREATERRAAAEAAERLRQQVADLIHGASQRLQSAGDQTSELLLALRDVNQALALDPENADALSLKTAVEESLAALREAARVRTVISNARTRFANGKHQAALRLLEDFQPSSHPDIAATLGELRGALLEIEEQRRIERGRVEKQERVAALLAEARTALLESPDRCRAGLLANAGEIDATAPELAPLMERASGTGCGPLQRRTGTHTGGRGRACHGRRFVRSERSVECRDGTQVRRFARAARAPPGRTGDRRTRGQRSPGADLEERTPPPKNCSSEATCRRHAIAEARPESGRSAPANRSALGRVEDAVKTREAADAVQRQRRTADELLAAAAAHLQSVDREPDRATLAIQKINQALALVPDDAGARALMVTAEQALAAQRQAAFVRTGVRNARSRFANAKYQAAFQLLENLDPSSNPVVADTLKELREALREIEERKRLEQERARPHTDASDEEATRVVLLSTTEAGHEDKMLASTQDVDQVSPEPALAESPSRERTEPVEEAAGHWPLQLVVGAGVLLLFLLIAVLLRGCGA